MASDTDPTRRNRLGAESSPYLQQHADNPVNWQPWDDRALQAAQERDVPIFLSIGYAACHWCHVMEEESFQNPEIAALLNEHFVPIKVDREERPDVDTVYMTVCQLVTGHGGWPLSVFLTPDRAPFYVGTYFPPEAKRGQAGFKQLLEDIVAGWNDPAERSEIEDRADQWRSAAAEELESFPGSGGQPSDSLLESTAEAARHAADRKHGGFGQGQKFPHPGRVRLLLQAADRLGTDEYREIATQTLDAMADGGLQDQLGGGFHRYTVDRDWTVPHFEKMLYDNAEIPRAYLAGYQVAGRDRYATVVRDTIAFLERELRHPDGGFYSSLDARSPPPASWDEDAASHGVEGAYYVWTPSEVRSVLEDEQDVALVCDRYGIDAVGNFEGRTVLTRHATIPELAEAHDLSRESVRERLDRAETQLLAHRNDRPRPARDEKIIAAWNGLAIRMLAEASLVLKEGRYEMLATEAVEYLQETLWDASARRLSRHAMEGDVSGAGYLEDYAFLAAGALEAYGVTADPEHLAFALDLGDQIIEEFWDPDTETLYFTQAGGERLLARPQELDDSSTPSSTGVAIRTLLRLDHFRPDDRARTVAEAVLDTHGGSLQEAPLQRLSLVLASDESRNGVLELTLAANDIAGEWHSTLASTYLPGRLLAPRPPGSKGLDRWLDQLSLDSVPPIWAGRERRNDATTAYVCRRACSPPLTQPSAITEWAERLSPAS